MRVLKDQFNKGVIIGLLMGVSIMVGSEVYPEASSMDLILTLVVAFLIYGVAYYSFVFRKEELVRKFNEQENK